MANHRMPEGIDVEITLPQDFFTLGFGSVELALALVKGGYEVFLPPLLNAQTANIASTKRKFGVSQLSVSLIQNSQIESSNATITRMVSTEGEVRSEPRTKVYFHPVAEDEKPQICVKVGKRSSEYCRKLASGIHTLVLWTTCINIQKNIFIEGEDGTREKINL